MIDKESAIKIATNHVSGLSDPAPGYRFVLGEMRLVEPGWYFDYEVSCDLDLPEHEQERFAGAFGFVVSKADGSVAEISYSDWVDLGLAFCDHPYESHGDED